MATAEQYADWIVKNADKRGTPEFETVASAYRLLRQKPDASAADAQAMREEYAPTVGMGGLEKFAAGVGKGATDLARGVGQRLGILSQADIDEARKLDAPLMATGAGRAGDVAGKVATALPTAFVPGANTLTGAALMGGALGVAEPTSGDESVLKNVALGAAAGPAGVMLGRGAVGLYQAGKALLEPFTKAGRDQIAGRVLSRFAADPSAVAGAVGGRTATGATPTLAEVTGDAGLARLQDALRSVDPQIANAIMARLGENNAARVKALQSLAGDSAKMDAATTARAAATKPLYQSAVAKTIEVDPELSALLSRPSVKSAVGRAANIAAEEGRAFGLKAATEGKPGAQFLDESGNVLFDTGAKGTPGTVSGQTLQDLKMGLDALLKDPTSGIAGKEAVNVKATRDALVQWMEKNIHEFNQARTTYAAKSKPINGMQVGEEIARRGTSALSDLSGNPRMQANALLRLLQDEQGLIRSATGRNELQSLADVFSPSELATLRQVASETDRAAAVASAGNGPGSATAQRLASQNVLRQLVGPTGLPESWAENALANTVIGKPLNVVYSGVAEPKIQQILAEAVLDPAKARQVLKAAQAGQIKIPDNMLTRLAATAAKSAASTMSVEPR